MPLPSFLQRFRSGAQTPAPQVQPLSPADIEQARVRARRRMIGMAVLVGAGVIGFPWLFETQPRPLGSDIQVVNAAAAGAATSTTPATRLASGKVTHATAEPVVPPQVSRALDAERSAKVAERAEAATAPREELVEDAPPAPKPERKPEPRPEPKKPEPKKPETKPVAPPSKPEAAKPAQNKPAVQAAASAKPADKKPVAATKPESKPEAKAAAKDEADTRYIVQVGAFADTATAHAARMKVERLGIKTYTQAVDTPGGKKVRVRVGPYANKADADKAMATLRKAGLTGALLTL